MCTSILIRTRTVIAMCVGLSIGVACSSGPETGADGAPSEEVTTPRNGDMAEVQLEDGSIESGIAVVIRLADGSTTPALFRGPSKLAEVASGGDYEFHEDSLPPRVRRLEAGVELRAEGTYLPRH